MSEIESFTQPFDDSHAITIGGTGTGMGSRMIKAGEIVGGSYKLKSLLGRGGMGYVFRAEHTIIEHDYALKILAPEILNEASRRRFEVEGRAIANLDHVNIVKVYNMGLDTGDCPFYVMDLLDGVALSDCIANKQDFTLDQCLNIFSQIAAGLGYAHEKGIVHRDVKPSNVVLLSDGKGGWQVKIVDFGIAKLLPSNQHSQSQTAPGEVFGSPLYMSPEQCLGSEVDKRSDVYSLGCSFYETLCGRPPFKGKNAMETVMMHQTATTPSALAERPDKQFPRAIDLLLTKMMAKKPADRYQSMEQLIHDFARIRLGKTIGKTMTAMAAMVPEDLQEPAHVPAPAETSLPETGGKQPLLLLTVGLAMLVVVVSGTAFWAWQGGHIFKGAKKGVDGASTSKDSEFDTGFGSEKPAAGQKHSSQLAYIDQLLSKTMPSGAVDKPDPNLARARDIFKKCKKIKSVIVARDGVRQKKFFFPEWPIGNLYATDFGPRTARGVQFAPADKALTLEIGEDQSWEVFNTPTIVDQIDADEFSGLAIIGKSVNAADSQTGHMKMESGALDHILKVASGWARLELIDLRHLPISGQACALLNDCKQLRQLKLHGDMTETADLVAQPFLGRLNSLSIDNTGKVDLICERLSGSRNLQSIEFCQCDNLSPAGLLKLRLCPNLTSLVLNDMESEKLIPVLAQLPHLKTVHLKDIAITPAQMGAITSTPIEHLYLSRSMFSPTDIEDWRLRQGKVSFSND